MNPLPFILLAISLPLLLGGCGEKDEGISLDELQDRGAYGYFEKNQEVGYTGKVFKLHENGSIALKGQLFEGKFDGLKVYWYENGKKREEINFKDGKKDGLWLYWHENGQKIREENYKGGKDDGLQRGWHENGQKLREAKWKDGKPVEGSGKYWNSKGEEVSTFREAIK